MFNQVTLIGRMGQDPEFRVLDNGTQVARFSVATSKNYQNQSGEWLENTTWHTVIAWRKLADRAQSTLKKGDLVLVTGEINHRRVAGSDGSTRYYTDVNASYFRKVFGRNGDSGRMPGAEDAPPDFPREDSDAPVVEADDDLPF